MCGRYSLNAPTSQIIEEFELFSENTSLIERFNIAPTEKVPVIKESLNGTKELTEMKWQFISNKGKLPMVINVRSETVREKEFFRYSFKYRRCIIPASSFFEWKKENDEKVPFLIKKHDNSLLGFAAIWERATDPQGQVIESVAILTTRPNSLMKTIHDRMPVILDKENYRTWLNPHFNDEEALAKLLVPAADTVLEAYRVSKKVNNARYKSPDIIDEVK